MRKAEEFDRAAEDAEERGDWNAAAANAIHAGISMADAVAVFYLGKRSAAEGHEESVRLLQQVDVDRKEVDRAVSHLTELLKVKNLAEYEERLLSQPDSERATKHLARFLTWARGKLPPSG